MDHPNPHPFDRERLTEDVLREWQSLVDIGAEIFGVKAGLITRLAGTRFEILLSSHTPGNPYSAGYSDPFPNSGWFCEETLRRRDLLVIPDAAASPEWKDNGAVVGLGMRSYAGMPLTQPDGGLFGTVCFIDDKANAVNDLYLRLLGQIRTLIELNLRIVYDREQIEARDRILDGLAQIYPICSVCKKVHEQDTGAWVAVEQYVKQVTGQQASHGLCPDCLESALAALDSQ